MISDPSGVVLPCFEANFYIVGNKIPKITGIFDNIDHPKSQGLPIWPKGLGH